MNKLKIYQEIFSKLPSAILYISSDQSTITYANASAKKLFSYLSLTDATVSQLLANDDERKKFDKFIGSSEERHEFVFTVSVDHKPTPHSSDTSAIKALVFRHALSAGTLYLIPSAKINPWQTLQSDTLTGLLNRALLHDRINQAIRIVHRTKQTFIAVMFIDLDRFKTINDNYGHAIGDALLVEISKRLLMCLRESDSVGRLGGDEFVALLCNLKNTDDIIVIASRILHACAQPIHIREHEFKISASLGISVYPTDGNTVENLIHHADAAMYASKDNGRNTFKFFNHTMNEKAKARATVESSLREAIQHQQFILHYQPQFCMSSNKIVSAEALVRWNHPARGMIPPTEFITVAEDTNLITPIGNWVLREAIAQGQRWKEMGLNLRVAVNLSVRQFSDGLVNTVESALNEHGLEPERLELELTESLLVIDIKKTIHILESLRSLGVKIALDDFGTGWSSLNYLKNFAVDTLKIDRSFIGSNIHNLDTRIVRAIIAIAREFDLSTLAEGVETHEQLMTLYKLGCKAWQGFLLSKPVPADELTAFCRNTNMAEGCYSVKEIF